MRVSQEKALPSNDFLKALDESKKLLPPAMQTQGCHNELALDCYNKLCCVPDPEPRLYADELLHLRDEQPLDKDLATLLVEECFTHAACYEYTLDNDPFGLHDTHKTFAYEDTSSKASLLLAKAAATKLGHPYKILPVSTLHKYDLQELLQVIYSGEQPCTVILHELNDESNIHLVKAFIESHGEGSPVHLLMTSNRHYSLCFNYTSRESTKELSCIGRLHLLQYYLNKLPIKTDTSCSEAYLTSVAERIHDFSPDKIERLAETILLMSLGKPNQKVETANITQNDIESVLKENYGITWLQGIRATLISRYWNTKK
jgi:hypothetical protein